jgi:type II secretory pathway pseudopilin PulG
MMRPHRGSALLAALIVIGVLSLVTVATLRLAGISKNQSVRDARLLGQASCVDAARQYLISRLALAGSGLVTDITFDQAVQLDNGTRHLYTGHVRPRGTDGRPIGTVPVIKSARGIAASQVTAPNGSLDVSNKIGGATLGNNYHVIVACADPVAGDMELEFTFRWAL